MQFDSYITESNKGGTIKAERPLEDLPQHYTDPYIRRYFILKYFCEASLLSFNLYGIKLTFQNLRAKRFKKFSPWAQIAVGAFYFDNQLYNKFAYPIENANVIKSNLSQFYHKQHYLNSQYWH